MSCAERKQQRVARAVEIEAKTLSVECGKCSDCGGDVGMKGKDYDKPQHCQLCRGKRKIKRAQHVVVAADLGEQLSKYCEAKIAEFRKLSESFQQPGKQRYAAVADAYQDVFDWLDKNRIK